VARSPSHVRWEGVTARGFPGGPAWINRGKALPYIPNRIPWWFAARYAWDSMRGEQVRLISLFMYDWGVFGDTGGAEIPVEDIHGPVLLVSGKDDQIWPSSLMAARLTERLRQHGHRFGDENLSYDRVGHWIPTEYLPTAGERHGMKLAIGGTAEDTARAMADSWPRILSFLTRTSAEEKNAP